MCYNISIMKAWLIVGLLAAGLVAVLVAGEPNQSSQKANKQANPVGPPTPPTVVNNNYESPAESAKANDNSPHWYTPLERSEWWLVVAAFLTLAVIWYQAKEMARATNEMRESTKTVKQQVDILERQTKATEEAARATQRSVELQEALNQQWLEVSGWRREGFGSRETNPPSFTIAVDVTNPTTAKLTVKSISIRIVGEPVMDYEVGNVLAPGGEPIKVTYSYSVKPEWLASYNKYALPLVVDGSIVFIDCFEKEQIQEFRRACFLGPVNHFQSSAIHRYNKAT